MFCAGFLAAHVTAIPGWGADQLPAQSTITLDVTNEPLGSVLAKITKKTSWKIKAPDKWLNRPVTQTLNKVTLEEGLRSVLNNAGVGNLLLLYDENIKVVNVFDTESAQSQLADRSSAPVQARANIQPPGVPAAADPDPRLQSPVTSTGPAPARVRRIRRQSSDDD